MPRPDMLAIPAVRPIIPFPWENGGKGSEEGTAMGVEYAKCPPRDWKEGMFCSEGELPLTDSEDVSEVC